MSSLSSIGSASSLKRSAELNESDDRNSKRLDPLSKLATKVLNINGEVRSESYFKELTLKVLQMEREQLDTRVDELKNRKETIDFETGALEIVLRSAQEEKRDELCNHYGYRAMELFSSGQPERARDMYLSMFEIESNHKINCSIPLPNNVDFLDSIKDALMKKERYQNVIDLCVIIYQEFTERHSVLKSLGDEFFEMEQYELAEQVYNIVIENGDNKDKLLLAKLGKALFEQAKNEEAEAVYRKALEIDPDDWEVRLALGWTLYYQDDKEREAIKQFNEVLKSDNTHGHQEAYNGKGLAYLFFDELVDAKKAYKNAIDMGYHNKQEISMAFHNLGVVYSCLKKYERSKEAYENCLEVVPESEGYMRLNSMLGIAEALFEQNEIDEAEEALERLLESIDEKELEPSEQKVVKNATRLLGRITAKTKWNQEV